MKLTQLIEQKERPYVVFHAKKGKYETHAVSSYNAAKNAAKHWGLKSTAGITPKLADVEHVAEEVITEGPCDVATRDDISKMNADEYAKYAQWKKDCEAEERTTPLSTKRLESYDDYHGDMSKKEYDKTVKGSEMEYSVWVGGTEANDNYLPYDEAVRLYDKYKAQGYDDVQLDARIKESYSPGDEYTDSEGMVSNCCGAPMMDYNDGHGRCGDCKEMAAGESEEEYYESVNEDEEAIAARDEFMKVMDMKPTSSHKAIDTIKQIVADKQNMQVKFDDGKMKVDLYTASAVVAVYNAVNDANKEKIDNMLRTKEGMLRMSNFAFSKLKEGIAEGKRIDEILPVIGAVAGTVARAVLPKLIKGGLKSVAKIGAGQAGIGAAKAAGGSIQKGADAMGVTASAKVKGKKLNAVKNDESIAPVVARVGSAVKNAVGGTTKGMIKDKKGKEWAVNSPQGKTIATAQAARDAKAGNSSTMNKAGQAVIGKKVAGGVKKAWGKAASGLAGVAQKSGFGNPLTASKQYADDMVEKAKRDAEEIEEISMRPAPKIKVSGPHGQKPGSHHPPAKSAPRFKASVKF